MPQPKAEPSFEMTCVRRLNLYWEVHSQERQSVVLKNTQSEALGRIDTTDAKWATSGKITHSWLFPLCTWDTNKAKNFGGGGSRFVHRPNREEGWGWNTVGGYCIPLNTGNSRRDLGGVNTPTKQVSALSNTSGFLS